MSLSPPFLSTMNSIKGKQIWAVWECWSPRTRVQPNFFLSSSTSRLHCLQFLPTASGVMMSHSTAKTELVAYSPSQVLIGYSSFSLYITEVLHMKDMITNEISWLNFIVTLFIPNKEKYLKQVVSYDLLIQWNSLYVLWKVKSIKHSFNSFTLLSSKSKSIKGNVSGIECSSMHFWLSNDQRRITCHNAMEIISTRPNVVRNYIILFVIRLTLSRKSSYIYRIQIN